MTQLWFEGLDEDLHDVITTLLYSLTHLPVKNADAAGVMTESIDALYRLDQKR